MGTSNVSRGSHASFAKRAAATIGLLPPAAASHASFCVTRMQEAVKEEQKKSAVYQSKLEGISKEQHSNSLLERLRGVGACCFSCTDRIKGGACSLSICHLEALIRSVTDISVFSNSSTFMQGSVYGRALNPGCMHPHSKLWCALSVQESGKYEGFRSAASAESTIAALQRVVEAKERELTRQHVEFNSERKRLEKASMFDSFSTITGSCKP
eukprot:1145666-Pelagomonas_calceolata.AAC.3